MGSNAKLLKQRLCEEKSRITDRQFFTSRLLAAHFEGIAAAFTRRYSYRQRVRASLSWEPKDGSIAYTDDLNIHINSGHEWVTKTEGRQARYALVCGLFAHEFGHIMYTDFLALQSHKSALAAGRWYPAPPALATVSDKRSEEALREYVKADEKQAMAVCRVAHELSNIIEDGYVENRVMREFPGTLCHGLQAVRAVHYAAIPTATQLKEAEEKGQAKFASFCQMLLSYAKFGEIKYGDEPLSDEDIRRVFGLLNEVDDALETHCGKDRLAVVNLILVRCWALIRIFCDQVKDQAEAEGCEIGEPLGRSLKPIGSSELGKSTLAPVAGAEVVGKGGAAESAREKTHKDAEGAKETGEGESDKDAERIPLVETDRVSMPEGGSTEKVEYESEQDEKAAADIEKILEEMAERAACKMLESERLKELNEFAENISYGDVHKGVSVRVHRLDEVGDARVELFNSISAPLIEISKQLQRSLIRQLEERQKGGKLTGLTFGRRLDSHAIHRKDGKLFYKRTLPNELPQLAVGLLLDESGSMYGDRVSYARAAAIILHDFCVKLGIPVMIYGHSTACFGSDEPVSLYAYAEFDAYDRDDRYRLMDVQARFNNRDGAALRYVAERLSKRAEEVKLLIVVSDGQPAAHGYLGTAAEEDLRGIKQEYRRKGLIFVAAAIGDDKENIERIYGDAFMDITDLKQLPTKLTSVVKRYIRL